AKTHRCVGHDGEQGERTTGRLVLGPREHLRRVALFQLELIATPSRWTYLGPEQHAVARVPDLPCLIARIDRSCSQRHDTIMPSPVRQLWAGRYSQLEGLLLENGWEQVKRPPAIDLPVVEVQMLDVRHRQGVLHVIVGG